ncbi:MAG: YraN family protein [Chitinophagales bacterium]
MQKTAEIGKKGENLAKEYLLNKQYLILHENWRYKRSEIDLIAQDGKIIVFVEVKSRKTNHFGHPEAFVTKHKIKKMQEAAAAYIEQFNWQGELRFDVISIENNKDITHFEDAFY